MNIKIKKYKYKFIDLSKPEKKNIRNKINELFLRYTRKTAFKKRNIMGKIKILNIVFALYRSF